MSKDFDFHLSISMRLFPHHSDIDKTGTFLNTGCLHDGGVISVISFYVIVGVNLSSLC